MTPHDLLANFETLSDAPNGIQRLRELVLELAVRGKLVEQDPKDEPAAEILKRIQAAKAERTSAKRSRNVISLPVGEDERPFEIPQNWAWTRATQLGVVNPRNEGLDEDAVAFVPMAVLSTDYRAEIRPELRLWKEIKKGYTHIADGDIAIAKITPCFENGKAAVFERLTGGYGAGTTELHVLRPIAGTIDPYFVLLFFRSPTFVTGGVATMTGTAGQQRVSGDYFTSRPIPLPPLPEQRRIVARVDELMALLDRLEAKRRDRETARTAARDSALAALREAPTPDDVETAWLRIQERFHELFATPEDVEPLRALTLELAVRGKLVEQDQEDEPADELLRRIQAISGSSSGTRHSRSRAAKTSVEDQDRAETEGGPLPRGWCCVPLSRLITFMDAGWSPACLGHPTGSGAEWGVLKTTAIQANSFEPQHNKALPPQLTPRPECEVIAGDLLVTRAGPWFRVGVSCYVSDCRPRLMLSDKIIRCRLAPGLLDGRWIALCINNGKASGFLRSKQTGMDAAQVNISQGRLASAPIEVPPLAEQCRIIARVDQLMTTLNHLSESLASQMDLAGAFAAAAVHHLEA